MVELRNDFDHLLIDLESSESNNVALVLRAIYDSDEHEKFMKKLDARIKNHDKDIERMCSDHYQGFTDCIHELLQVRPRAESLKRETLNINMELMRSTDVIQRKAEDLIKSRRILVNSKTSIELLQKCLPVLKQYSKLNTQINEQRYYTALKTLESLENDHLPTVAKYRFAQGMCEEIPKFREKIKSESLADLKDFLANILHVSQKIGDVVLRNSAKQQNSDDYDELIGLDTSATSNNNTNDSRWQKLDNFNENHNNNIHSSPYTNQQNRTDTSRGTSSSAQKRTTHKKGRAPLPPTKKDHNNGDSSATMVLDSHRNSRSEDEINVVDLVDFTPVYRCLHVFTCLNCRDQFNEYYQEQRQKQSKLAFNPPSNMSQSISYYHDYFSSVVGFFVIEDHLMGTTSGLIKQAYIDDLWKDAVQSMTSTLSQQYKLCNDAALMLKIKRLMMLYIYTVRIYGHNTDPLTNILIDIRGQYNEILKKQWQSIFEEIFRSDNYIPLEFNNNEQYLEVVGNFSLYEIEGSNFPRKFPFSSSVPKVDKEVRRFIEQSLKFSQDLNSSQADIEEMVRRSTNQLISEILGGCLSSLIKNPNLQLLRLIQITINSIYLEESMKYLDEHITYQVNRYMSAGMGPLYSMSNDGGSEDKYEYNEEKAKREAIGANNHGSKNVRIQTKSMLKDAKADAITQIHKKLNDQIDEWLSLANYDWTMASATGQASSYISGMIAWLEETFQAFTSLPQEIAQSACMSACKYIAQSLRNMILSDEVKALSVGALEQFNLDLIRCEQFSESEPVKGFKEGDLQTTFAELRQICDLFIYQDSTFSFYISDMGKQQNKYLRVSTATALNIAEKLREYESRKNVFALMKNERQKTLESFAKRLRQSQHQQQIQNQQYQYDRQPDQ